MYPEQDRPILPEPQQHTYTPADTVYAWLSLVLAFLLCQATPAAEHPLGCFLLIVGLFLSGFVILRVKKQRLSPACILSAVSALVISSALLLTDTVFLMRLSLAYSLASYCYFLYAAFGNRIEEGFSDYIYADFLKALLLLPFGSFWAIFQALSTKSTKKASGILLKVLFGMGMAIIPTIAVFIFLSYDQDFLKLMDDIFSFESWNFGRTLRNLAFAVPMGMYGFGLYASSQRKVLQAEMTPQSCESSLRKLKALPQLTVCVAVLPIVFLYIVFFISQWKYYISGFTGILPQDFSYAEYARRGFFDLCCVSIINLLLIIGISLFMKRGENNRSVILKLLTTLFCLCTLILISTAVAKLVMYIDYYGLTPKRIYAMWLMVLIAIVFLLIALGQFLRKLKTVALSVTIAIVLFAGLAVCNVNTLCAQYNAEGYLSGTLETFDADAMADLGDSAVPALVRVAREMDAQKDPQLQKRIDWHLRRKQEAFEQEERSIFSFSIPWALARSALADYSATLP